MDGNKEAKWKCIVSKAWVEERSSHIDLDLDKSS
jgi:hypothetical protein